MGQKHRHLVVHKKYFLLTIYCHGHDKAHSETVIDQSHHPLIVRSVEDIEWYFYSRNHLADSNFHAVG